MTTLGYDCAFPPRPDPAAAYKVGYRYVLRYLYDPQASATNPGKALTAAEVTALHKAGLSILAIWETTTGRATQGYAAGVTDRQQAERIATQLGYPHTSPIFYAVDSDVDPATVAPYFAGVRAGHSFPVGVYGSRRVIEATTADYRWQTEAWSGTVVSDKADVYQRVAPTLTMKGSYDEDVILHPVPAWPPRPLGPLPVWYHRSLRVGDKGPDVRALKRRLHVLRLYRWRIYTQTFGRGVAAAVESFQRGQGLPVTGVVDATTARRLRRPA